MLQQTNGIVLRCVKYGDTSIVTTVFTRVYGLQTYLVQGVRNANAAKNRAAYFQPGVLLDMVARRQPLKNMQRIREYNAAYIYTTLLQDVIKNSIALFSLEVLLRVLPEHAPVPALFDFAWQHFITLDKTRNAGVANFPLFFITRCGRELGYDLKGAYSALTPHLNWQEGGFATHAPSAPPFVYPEDAALLSQVIQAGDYDTLAGIRMNADARIRLTDWLVSFLQTHTQHMGSIKSLSVLRAILH